MSHALVIAMVSVAAALIAARIVLEPPPRNWFGTAIVLLVAAGISYSALNNRFPDNALIGAGMVLVLAAGLFGHALWQRRKARG